VRSLVSHILQINGFIVLEARSGEEALDVCRQHRGPVHVVVSDMMLPGMRGPELVERLTDVYPQLRAVFISGYVDAPHPLPGGAPFLRKPFAVGDLVRAVYRAMSDDAS
jgi:two-component system cell cycle sensor histidine kinase/response regulator CckA